jgi:hypothetical protein
MGKRKRRRKMCQKKRDFLERAGYKNRHHDKAKSRGGNYSSQNIIMLDEWQMKSAGFCDNMMVFCKLMQALFVKITENKIMNITKADLYEALIQARVALSKDISNMLRDRNGIAAKYARASAREKIAAYRLLSNLSTINAESYSDNRSLRHVKKALAK